MARGRKKGSKNGVSAIKGIASLPGIPSPIAAPPAKTVEGIRQHKLPQLSKQMLSAERKRAFVQGLPHLYGQKLYAWQRTFLESRNKMNLLTAANQIGKSTIQIKKCIHWATNKKIWPELWPAKDGREAPVPNLFWYLYPSKDVAHYEWKTKWLPLMPRDTMKKHPVYGWEEAYDDKGRIESITFNSGVIVVFKTYGQKATTLQTATVYAVFCDEELPESYYDEIAFRLEGTEGYFHLVFTATLGQQLWYCAMEGTGETEKFVDACKQQISMYDCQVYEDGTPGPYFDTSRIDRAKARCKSQAEIDKRVYGKFVLDASRKYAQYEPTRHFIKPRPIPPTWHRYAAVDIGSGGVKGAHPPAISFVAISPDHRMGYVYKGWRGDDGRDYTSGDILDKFIDLRGDDRLVTQRFDQNAKDFGQIAMRIGEPFLPSEKHHDIGEDVVNTLFKNDMLFIFDDSVVSHSKTNDGPQLHKLGGEMLGLKRETTKAKAKDDFIDSMRYCVVGIPWDWSALRGEKTDEAKIAEKTAKQRHPTAEEITAEEIRRRRGDPHPRGDDNNWQELTDEFDFWNGEYGT